MSINIQINRLLEQQGRSRYWLSKKTGISHQSLTKIAKNETTSIRFEHIESICKALECTPNELLGWE